MNRSVFCHVRSIVAALSVLICLPGEGVSQRQTVFLVAGDVQPRGLSQEQPLPRNTRNIIVSNGLVVVQEFWSGPTGQCVGWVVISNMSWRVQGIATPGECRTTGAGSVIPDVSQGKSLVAHMVFYGEGKADETGVPPVVAQSRAERRKVAIRLHELGQQIDTARDSPRPTMASDLTGTWKDAPLGGTYFVRQIGNVVWWYGQSVENGRDWAHVFHGVRDGPVIRGQWADVPKGTNRGSGALVIQLDTTGLLRILEQTGGFGPQVLRRTP